MDTLPILDGRSRFNQPIVRKKARHLAGFLVGGRIGFRRGIGNPPRQQG
jgi:hypothetical protein